MDASRMTKPQPSTSGEPYDATALFRVASPEKQVSTETWGAERWGHRDSGDVFRTLDVFPDGSAACCFARCLPGATHGFSIALIGGYSVAACESGGWLFVPESRESGAHYWLPQPPGLRRLDEAGHVLAEQDGRLERVTVSPSVLGLEVDVPAGWALHWILWRFAHASQSIIGELWDLTSIETARNFLWGSHTEYSRPADVYLHLVHGHVYENRFSWPKYWKICSENDAHALYTILSGLASATGKELYRLLKLQLLLSVLDRQGEDGGWRHGEWTDRMESHYRLHCSAMHMLMDALAENDDPTLRTALERAAAFLARQHDRLDAGIWFLHDELEHSVEALREGPFRWLPSRTLGKSESNMLVLNSHLDATIALDRYREITGDGQYQDLVAQAVAATRAVLSLRPAEWLYRLIFRAIRLTFLPTREAQQLPRRLRALKRVAWKYLIPLLPRLKARWPRLAMPGGYVERELSLRAFAHDYLPINLMDLLRYRRRFSAEPWLDEIIVGAVELISDCRMTERWPEIEGKEYALGFWAEALYHACLAFPDACYRAMLAEAVIALQKRNMGLPPSLLGANSEAVAPRDQAPTPDPDDERIRVVNLSRKGVAEVLLVNCSEVRVPLRFARNAPAGLVWTAGTGAQGADRPPHEVAPGEWLWGRGERAAPAAS